MACVYLSPSGQQFNPFLNGGSEEYFSNLIADAVQVYLDACGICYARNMPWMSPRQAASEANVFNFDAYLAIHSNAASPPMQGQATGCQIYYYTTSSRSRNYALLTAQHYRQIYPVPSKVSTLPSTTLIELNATRAPAILVETGYHDNMQDEAWIKANINNIAKALAHATADFCGVPFAVLPTLKRGVVVTNGSSLLVRSGPSSSYSVVGALPNGATVDIACKCGLWYMVNYGGLQGFSAAAYIAPADIE